MRSGYSDNLDQRDLAMYRGRVASAIRGRRGQRLLCESAAALDAMPEKRLVPDVLIDGKDVCLLGAVGVSRQVELIDVDPEDHDRLGKMFDAAPCLIREIEFANDEGGRCGETPEERWTRVRRWVAERIVPFPA